MRGVSCRCSCFPCAEAIAHNLIIEYTFSNAIGSSVTEDEIRQAEEKFAESLHLAQMGMHNILENDVIRSYV